MGRHLNDARHHEEEIKRYHRHAGADGYAQAQRHYEKLAELMRRAAKSKHEKSDAVVIQAMRHALDPLMEEMERRSTGQDST